MRCTGRLLPWQLERRIDIEDSVYVEYVYTNVGADPHRAFWCAHPLFKYEPVLGVEVAEGTSTKLFLPSGYVDNVKLLRVEISWDSLLLPDVAIWMCNGDLGGYRQIAVEPSWTRESLGPGEIYSWWLRITAL